VFADHVLKSHNLRGSVVRQKCHTGCLPDIHWSQYSHGESGEACQARRFQRRSRLPDVHDIWPPALPLQSVKRHSRWCRCFLLERLVHIQGLPLDVTDIRSWRFAQSSHDFWRIHGDLFNMPQLFLGGVKIQIKFTKAKSDFYVLSSKSDARAVFKFSDATMYLKHVNLSPRIQLWKRRTPDQIWPEGRSTQSRSVSDRIYIDSQCRLGNLT
jgi:hypothetical protein